MILIKDQKFGIEIEMTGLTRQRAAEVIAEHFGTTASHVGAGYDAYHIKDNSNRTWKIMSDASITPQVKSGTAGYDHKVELVSPICVYDDIETIQNIARKLRENNALVNSSCGIHYRKQSVTESDGLKYSKYNKSSCFYLR